MEIPEDQMSKFCSKMLQIFIKNANFLSNFMLFQLILILEGDEIWLGKGGV